MGQKNLGIFLGGKQFSDLTGIQFSSVQIPWCRKWQPILVIPWTEESGVWAIVQLATTE